MDTHYLDPPRLLSLKTGEDDTLEEKAAELLAQGRKGITALSEKRDYLTFDQLQLRYRREVSNSAGWADESIQSGLFRRAYNPLAGRRPRRSQSSEW
jgi:hypothetical protein